MVDNAVILNVDNLRQRLKGDLTCLFHPPKQGAHMMPCPLNCGSCWCPNSKVILSLMDHPSRAQGHVCRRQKKSYKERFSSGVYAIYPQAHMPSPNFSSEHHTSYPTTCLVFPCCLKGISNLMSKTECSASLPSTPIKPALPSVFPVSENGTTICLVTWAKKNLYCFNIPLPQSTSHYLHGFHQAGHYPLWFGPL